MTRISNKIMTTLFASTCFLPLGTAIVATAQPAAAQATVSGVALPKGGEPWTKANTHFTSMLNDLAKTATIKRAIKGGVQTISWSGDDYQEDRVKIMQSTARRAFTDAGYTVRFLEGNDTDGFNEFAHFDVNEENLPFLPSTAKQSVYFVAENAAKGQAFIGAWMESTDRLILTVAPIAFVAKTGPMTLPAIPPGAILIQAGDNVMKDNGAQKMPMFTPLTKKPRTVRGQVKDASGKPIAGAEIAVHCSAGGGFRTTHTARSNAQGIYEVLVPAGVAQVVQVTAPVTYNGEKMDLPLEPATGEAKQFDSKVGHVENYVMKTAGGGGGTLRFVDGLDKSGTVEVMLTPIGKMMDGSTGRIVIFRFDRTEGYGETFLHGVPLGRYKLTARWFDKGETIPLRAAYTSSTNAELALRDSVEINFKSGFTYTQGQMGKSNANVAHFEVNLNL